MTKQSARRLKARVDMLRISCCGRLATIDCAYRKPTNIESCNVNYRSAGRKNAPFLSEVMRNLRWGPIINDVKQMVKPGPESTRSVESWHRTLATLNRGCCFC